MRARLIVSCVLSLAAALAPTASPDTAVLTGVVVSDTASPRPLHRATVRLAGAGTTARMIGTDDAGRFTFDALPGGTFTLSAAKPGFVQTFYGSKRPGRGPGVPIALADGGRADVTLKMLPGAAIAGVVTDAVGRPAPEIAVAAVQLRASEGSAPVRATTDDRGVYRIYGLAPGDYLVSALPRIVPAGTRGRPPGEIIATTDEEVQWAARATGDMPPPGRPVAHAPVYYPGVTDAGGAGRVTLAAGEERAGVDIALRVVPMSRISGTLVDGNDQPVSGAGVGLYPRRRDGSSVADMLVSSGAAPLPRAVVSGGTFSIASVAPGEYTLVARTGRGRGAAPPPGGALWSVTDIVVDGFDQDGLVLRLLPGVQVTGSIAFDRSTLPTPTSLEAFDLSLVSTTMPPGAASTFHAVVDPRGTFRVSNVPPGVYSFHADPPASAKWTLRSAMLDTRDLSDGRFDVKAGGEIQGVTVTFTDHPTEISGRLVDAAGVPVAEYTVVVFAIDQRQWYPDSRRIRAVRPSNDGSFRIAGLPPGEYAMAPIDDVEPGDLADAAVLAPLVSRAVRVTVTEGAPARMDLRLGGG